MAKDLQRSTEAVGSVREVKPPMSAKTIVLDHFWGSWLLRKSLLSLSPP
jgi:hypothetical protein